MASPAILLLIPLLPALGALINGSRAFAAPHTPKNKALTNFIALASTGLSALLAAYVVIAYYGNHEAWKFDYFTWIPAGMEFSISSTSIKPGWRLTRRWLKPTPGAAP